VRTAAPGRYGDGGGLYLLVRENGTRFWTFRWVREKRMREMGLGAVGTAPGAVSLADARTAAAELRRLVRSGVDPLAQRDAEKAAVKAAIQQRTVKAKVEAGVRFAQSYILGRLRRQTFFSLAEANQAIAGMVERMNAYVMRRLGKSRQELFETVERPVLSPLPETDHEFAEWRFARVSLDYHIELEGFFYSVPHKLIREQVDTRLTARMVEIFYRGQRVGDPTIADAILDRLVYNAYRIELTGESLRKGKAPEPVKPAA
jgi:hypothetical protein